jgi:protein-disulfide isomerase
MRTVSRRAMIMRLSLLAGLAAVAVLAVVAVGGPGQDAPAKGGGSAAPDSALRGIPQSGIALGSPDAPVTMVEFADLQCPFCAEYQARVFPELLDRYVRTGKLRIELRLLRFLGPDSDRLARAASAAAAQDRMWQLVELGYARQGRENSGYATDAFIKSLLADAGVHGADTGAPAEPELRRATQAARKAGINSTPSFLIGPTGGTLARFEPGELTPGPFVARIQEELRR